VLFMVSKSVEFLLSPSNVIGLLAVLGQRTQQPKPTCG
jgi:hypothetical protein